MHSYSCTVDQVILLFGLEQVCTLGGIWYTLNGQQTTAIHTAAFYLDPADVNTILTPEAQVVVFAFLKKYMPCDEEI